MLQVHTLILWASASKSKDFEDIAKQAYELLALLKDFGAELNPTYQTVRRKSEVKPLKGTYEEFKQILRNGANKEGKTVFSDLGYSASFFSSLKDMDSAGIKLTVGVTNPQFKNTFTVRLPANLSLKDLIIIEKLKVLFEKSIEIFKPFWGCVVNEKNGNRYDNYWHPTMKIPTAIHWLNYFGEDLVKRLGKQKIEKAPVELVKCLDGGYFILLKNQPIDDENQDDIRKQKVINEYFGL